MPNNLTKDIVREVSAVRNVIMTNGDSLDIG